MDTVGREDELFMRMALEEARLAFGEDEVPVGAVLVRGGRVIARARNSRETTQDPTAHAETLLMRGGSGGDGWRFHDCTLYVTKEPCVMCAGTMVLARLGRLVFGCPDPKGGGVVSLYGLLGDPRLNHRAEVLGGVLQEECAALLREFFAARRLRARRGGEGA